MENDGPGFSVDAAIERLNELSRAKSATAADVVKRMEETRQLRAAIGRIVRPYLPASSDLSVADAVDVLANAIKLAVRDGYLIGEPDDLSDVGEKIRTAIRPYLR